MRPVKPWIITGVFSFNRMGVETADASGKALDYYRGVFV